MGLFAIVAIAVAVLMLLRYVYHAITSRPTTASPGRAARISVSSSSRAAAAAAPKSAEYVPFSQAADADALVVDCTHVSQPTFTHHKGSRNPPGLLPADTSTGLVLNALATGAAALPPGWLDRKNVTVNHFDGDALFSVWAFINRKAALQHAGLLRAAAALSDFRELPKDADESAAALKLCCWINSVEREAFSPPYEDHDADEKFSFFLEELGLFMMEPERYRAVWQQEFDAVQADIRLIKEQGAVRLHDDIGVAVVECPRPVHYYALFSCTVGCDVVVSLYGDRRHYEVEGKYTQFVCLHSRPVAARLNMQPLAAALNTFDSDRTAGTQWTCPSHLDTGPLLRLDLDGQALSKKERYGHPTARHMHFSGLSKERFEAAVVSYFRHGLAGTRPKKGGWSWEELSELNSDGKIDWEAWWRSVGSVL